MAKIPGNRRFNEHPSPPVVSRKFQTLQVLNNLGRVHQGVVEAILGELGFDETDFSEMREALYQELIDEGVLEECGCCGHYHRRDFRGDCRNDDERFPGW